MIPQKAIDTIKHGCIYRDKRGSEALIVAISALEKQIPKKPKVLKVHNVSNYKYGYCECGESICDVDNYCAKCGQALDWGDTE